MSSDSNNEPWMAYDDMDWDELPQNIQEAATTLGWTQDLWDSGDEEGVDTTSMYWRQLSREQQAAATLMGHNPESWNDDTDTNRILNYVVQQSEDLAAGEYDHMAWDELRPDIQEAASAMGRNEQNWNGGAALPRTSNKDNITSCANCGKGEGCDLKLCNACKMIKYCSRDCQIAHWPQHKKACKKRAAELHDIVLFKHPPPEEDCPICMLRLPSLETGLTYKECCGKTLCTGCIIEVWDRSMKKSSKHNPPCPFCRTPESQTTSEFIDRYKKRMEAGDAHAFYNMGCYYCHGDHGLPQDMTKALELWHRAGELGDTEAYYGIGTAYMRGDGVQRSEKKRKHYYELAAMGGHAMARHNLGSLEGRSAMLGQFNMGGPLNAGSYDRAIKHYMISVACGYNHSLTSIQEMFKNGRATKDDYMKALNAYQAYLEEIKSDQRDKAAASSDRYKYYED